jgi:hypothetical protein
VELAAPKIEDDEQERRSRLLLLDQGTVPGSTTHWWA